MRSDPVTVPPENDTVAESLGRLGSGSAYDVGQAAADGDALAVGRGLALGVLLGLLLGLGASVTVDVSDGVADSAASGPSDTVDVLQPARSTATTTALQGRQVRTCRR
ncbi:MAG: hypothetical protein QOE05_3559 [Actinomycetota bacterium]|jgi:hypothetical protein|nr:hypothetical protein [Actinomycetota bacterium]